MRQVQVHLDLEAGEHALCTRDDVALWDLHGLYWTIPAELTVAEANEQIALTLARHSLERFHDPVRVHQASWPANPAYRPGERLRSV